MCSINHNKKAIFIHLPKNAGVYIRELLEDKYNFQNFFCVRPDHSEYCNTNLELNNPNLFYTELTFTCNKGIIEYFKTSSEINDYMDMDLNKWDSYYKFTIVRNPYTRVISAWTYLMQYCHLNIDFDKYLDLKDSVSEYEYSHIFLNQSESLYDSNNKCLVNYICKFENLESDFNYVIKNLGFKDIYFSYKNKTNLSKYKFNYEELFTQKTLNIINEIYDNDFKNFGYVKYDNLNDLLNSLDYKKNISKSIFNINRFNIMYGEQFNNSVYNNVFKYNLIIDSNIFNFINELPYNRQTVNLWIKLNDKKFIIKSLNYAEETKYFKNFLICNHINEIENFFNLEKYSLSINNIYYTDFTLTDKEFDYKNFVNLNKKSNQFVLIISISNSNSQLKIIINNNSYELNNSIVFSNRYNFSFDELTYDKNNILIITLSYLNGYNKFNYNQHPNNLSPDHFKEQILSLN